MFINVYMNDMSCVPEEEVVGAHVGVEDPQRQQRPDAGHHLACIFICVFAWVMKETIALASINPRSKKLSHARVKCRARHSGRPIPPPPDEALPPMMPPRVARYHWRTSRRVPCTFMCICVSGCVSVPVGACGGMYIHVCMDVCNGPWSHLLAEGLAEGGAVPVQVEGERGQAF